MSTWQDVRIAFRMLRRSPVPTGIAILSIALSVGATAVVFAAIKSVLIDPLPYSHPEELVQIRTEYPRMQQQSTGDWVDWHDSEELARRTNTLTAVGVYRNAILDLAGTSGVPPEALYGLRVTANLFPLLGVSPMLGRNFTPEEDRAGQPDVVILSHGLWARRFQSNSGIVGRFITMNGHNCKVIGVMPPQFNFPLRRSAAHTPSPYVEFWAPLGTNREGGLGAVARLKPGVPVGAAREEAVLISNELARAFPTTNRDHELRLNPVLERTVGHARNGLLLLLGATMLFLLIGCANVANLLLARGFGRQKEMIVRTALGASTARLARQLLTESCVLAILGGLAGYLLTAAAWIILPAVVPASIPRLAAARADSSVLGFALAVGILSGLVFGMAPAIRLVRRTSFQTARGIAAGGRDRMRASLVVAEIALSVVLVVTGGELLTSFSRLISTDPGFQPDGVLASVVLPAQARYRTPEERALFYRRILDAARAIPGVDNAGTVDALPFSGENNGGTVSNGNGQDALRLEAEIDVAGGQYLQTMGIRLLDGRWFRDEEMNAMNDSAIINEYVANRLWPGKHAVGQSVCVYCSPEHPDNWKRVIGVVANVTHAALDEREKGNVYLTAGAMERSVFLAVRTKRPLGEIGRGIRQAIAAIDPNQPVFLSVPMRELIADSVADRRFIMTLLVVTGLLGWLMSAAGVYGVIAYTTALRTAEIGIRMAIGATPRQVLAMVFRQGFVNVAVGLGLGLGTAMGALQILKSLVVGLGPTQAGELLASACLVTATAAAACWIPARRAAEIDPIAALREE